MDNYNCPKCGAKDVLDPEIWTVKVTSSGSYSNASEGTVYWFEGEVTCPECKHVIEVGGSS